MSLGKEIRKLRIDKGLSQKDLHQMTGLSQKYLSEIEHDKVDPRTAILVRIADALEVSTDRLLERETPPARQKRPRRGKPAAEEPVLVGTAPRKDTL